MLYPEVADTTARWLQKTFGQPTVRTVPIGVLATREFVEEVGKVACVDVSALLERERAGTAQVDASRSLLPWYSRSVDSTYLTGKRVFVFGDATHVMAAARMAKDELGFTVVGIGTYSREYARPIRDLAAALGVEALISDDYLAVEQRVTELAPELVLGTQMERHIAKRLGVPCAVISAPIHVQDVPARHSPQMGFEGANVIFDTWVHPLMMGLEEHLLHMFKDDFEFGDGATPSHLHASPTAGGDDRPARGDMMGGQRATPFTSRAAIELEAPEAASAVGFAEEEDEVDVESGGGSDGGQHADAAVQDDDVMGQAVAPVVKSSPVGSRSSSTGQVKRKMSKDGSKAGQPPAKKERTEDEGATAAVPVSSAPPKKKSSKKARRGNSNGGDDGRPERKLKLPSRGLLSH